MEKLILQGRWNEIKGVVKQKYGSLTDDDLAYVDGKFDELVGRIQVKTGQTKEEVIEWLDSIK